MKFAKDKAATLIALFLALTFAFSLVAIPVNADEAPTFKTYAYLGATPNPVGVGQEVLLHIGVVRQLATADMGWTGITVTVTTPSGDTETLGPFTTDSTGGTGTIYVPDEAGEYTLQAHFPEQVIPAGGGVAFFDASIADGTVMLASDSDEVILVVTEEPVEYYPSHALPTEYWTRPIDAQLREWYAITGNWLTASWYTSGNRYAPYNDGPETAHVLWTKELTIGGLAGGSLGLVGSGATSVGYGTGDAYEGLYSTRLIVGGRLYYTEGGSTGTVPVVYHCVDLHTGEELWSKTFLNNQTLSLGQDFYFESYNYQGTFEYLWVGAASSGFGGSASTTWTAFDAYTGNWRFTIENVPTGTTITDEKGGLYVLKVDLTNGWMALWNMTHFGVMTVTPGREYYSGGGSWGDNVHFLTLDAAANTTAAKSAWMWNVTIPTDLPGSVQATFFNDRIIGANIVNGASEASVWGISIEEGSEGSVLFNTSWDVPDDWVTGNQTLSWAASSEDDLVGVLWAKQLRQHYGISLETGKLIWGPSDSQYYLDMWEGTGLTSHLVVYGRLYTSGVSGIVYCYNVTTGELLWSYAAADVYTESSFSSNWWLGIAFITDGKIYAVHGEHSSNQPLPRGAPFICLNATTGDLIWRADGLFRSTGSGGMPIIGDSVIAALDTYDNRLYGVAKGPTATTASASPKVSVHGDSVLVEGMVTDISPSTEDYALTARFPNGVPAVCDANMSEWMAYVYKQFERPADIIGVEVVISVVDPNNNCYDVGTTTSDASGFYKLAFTPEVPGEYTIIASFAGSKAYYGSFAETAINVQDAPAATAEPTPMPASVADTYLLPGIIGIIIAVVVVGLVIILMLKKR